MTQPRASSLLENFSTRFVILCFGGAAVGLLIGLIGRSVFNSDWNPFWGMAVGIFVGSVISGSYRRRTAQRKASDPGEDRVA